jgi:hypothetical protein
MTTTPLAQSKVIHTLAVRMDAMEAQQAATAKAAKATADMVKEIHDVLMKHQPGQEGSFMDRATVLLLNVESGERLVGWIIAIGKVAVAIAAIVGIWVSAVKFGIWPEGK